VSQFTNAFALLAHNGAKRRASTVAEQSTANADWKLTSLLMGLVVVTLALITALAIHFGYGDQLSQALKYMRDHYDGISKVFDGIEYIWKHAPEWVDYIWKHAPAWLKEHPPRKL
jgi:hypothetical protein